MKSLTSRLLAVLRVRARTYPQHETNFVDRRSRQHRVPKLYPRVAYLLTAGRPEQNFVRKVVRSRERSVAACLFGISLLIAAQPGMARSAKTSPDLNTSDSGALVDVIVQFAKEPGLSQKHAVSRSGGRLKAELPG